VFVGEERSETPPRKKVNSADTCEQAAEGGHDGNSSNHSLAAGLPRRLPLKKIAAP